MSTAMIPVKEEKFTVSKRTYTIVVARSERLIHIGVRYGGKLLEGLDGVGPIEFKIEDNDDAGRLQGKTLVAQWVESVKKALIRIGGLDILLDDIRELEESTKQNAKVVTISTTRAGALVAMHVGDWIFSSNGFASERVCAKITGDLFSHGPAALEGFQPYNGGPILSVKLPAQMEVEEMYISEGKPREDELFLPMDRVRVMFPKTEEPFFGYVLESKWQAPGRYIYKLSLSEDFENPEVFESWADEAWMTKV